MQNKLSLHIIKRNISRAFEIGASLCYKSSDTIFPEFGHSKWTSQTYSTEKIIFETRADRLS